MPVDRNFVTFQASNGVTVQIAPDSVCMVAKESDLGTRIWLESGTSLTVVDNPADVLTALGVKANDRVKGAK